MGTQNRTTKERGKVVDILASTQSDYAHLQRPHSSDPHLEPALDAIHTLKLDTLPPAPARGLPPKEQQLLRHADSVVAHFVAADVGA